MLRSEICYIAWQNTFNLHLLEDIDSIFVYITKEILHRALTPALWKTRASEVSSLHDKFQQRCERREQSTLSPASCRIGTLIEAPCWHCVRENIYKKAFSTTVTYFSNVDHIKPVTAWHQWRWSRRYKILKGTLSRSSPPPKLLTNESSVPFETLQWRAKTKR